MGWLKAVDEWIDAALEAAKNTSDRAHESANEAWERQVSEAARQAGVVDAQQDWAKGVANTIDFGRHDWTERYYDLAADMPQGPALPIPSTSNPLVAAIEVLFTPSEIEEGRLLEGRERFAEAYYEAYRDEVIDQFDDRLDRLLQPDPDAWRQPSDCAQGISVNDFPPLLVDSPSAPVQDAPSVSSQPE